MIYILCILYTLLHDFVVFNYVLFIFIIKYRLIYQRLKNLDLHERSFLARHLIYLFSDYSCVDWVNYCSDKLR